VESFVASWAFILMMFAGGGIGFPLGVPPLPQDPVVVRSAPEECLAYFSSAGMAKPDPRSSNRTERLVSEPEVRRLGTEIEKLIRSQLKEAMKGRRPEEQTLAEDGPTLAKVLLTRPLAFYVAQLKIVPQRPPDIRAGLVVSLGDDTADVKAAVDRLYALVRGQSREVSIGDTIFHQTPLGSGGPEVTWGIKGQYLYAATGEGELEALLKRSVGEGPRWLTELHKQLPVERVATVSMVNVRALGEVLAPLGPQVAQVMDALGASGIDRLAGVSGLDKEGYVSRSLLSLRGEPQGLLQLLDQKPLTTADLELVPRDATFACALKLDPARAWTTILGTTEKIDPEAKRRLTERENETGRELREGLLKALGDTWCLFDSPSGGGLFVGVTVVVSIKDAEAARAVEKTLIHLAESAARDAGFEARKVGEGEQPRPVPRPPSRGVRVRNFTFAGKTVQVFEAGEKNFPLAPAWCLTDKHLVVGLYPEAVKAFLARGDGFQALTKAPEVAAALEGEGQILALSYVDTRRLFDLIYPFVPVGVAFTAAQLRHEGIDLPPGLLPSAGSIRPHLRPSVSVVRRTQAGVETISRQTLPGSPGLSSLPIAVGLLVPAVQKVRQASARIQSGNNLKQIGLALHSYHDVNQTLPSPAIYSKDGKPLLSWRVAILPYLEQEDLYKQFKLDEPWDSPHNKALLSRMPKVYVHPMQDLVREPHATHYQVFVGKREHAVRPIFTEGGPGLTLAAITNADGCSQTWLAVEAADGIPWTKPGDLPYSPKGPLPRLGRFFPGAGLVLFADGSVRSMRYDLKEEAIRALITYNDGIILSGRDLGE
jgi:hypothetical protein